MRRMLVGKDPARAHAVGGIIRRIFFSQTHGSYSRWLDLRKVIIAARGQKNGVALVVMHEEALGRVVRLTDAADAGHGCQR